MHSIRQHVLQTVIPLFFVAGFLFPATIQLNAQEPATGTPSTTPPARTAERAENAQQNVASRTEAIREKVAEQKEVIEERRAGLKQAALDRIQNLLGNITRRMEAAIARLENITSRLQSRSEKIASEYGVNVDAALSFIENAESELDTAKAKIAELKEDTGGTLGSENPRAQFLEVKAALREISGHIKSAHQLLREAVAALKDALRESEDANGVRDAVSQNSASGTSETIEE